MERLLIVDGTVLVIRPWFAGQPAPWKTALGLLRAHLREASHLAVVMDITLDTFRREIEPTYKSNRVPAPPDLIEHFDRFRDEAQALNVPVLSSARYEADDLSASLTRLAGAEGLAVGLISDDKDLFQLVRDAPDVRVEDRFRGKVYDPRAVEEKLGVTPAQVVDYLSLVGDASDGVRGVPGVGAQTAATLLKALGSLDAIYADLDAVARLPMRGARGLPAKLLAGKDAALLARRLVTLQQDVALPDGVLAMAKRR